MTLTNSFVSYLATGRVLEDYRVASVDPLFMKESRDNPGNFWPKSLASIVEKQLETIFWDRIYSYLEEYEIIRDSKHSFIRRSSGFMHMMSFLRR